ncbi:MerR family transcriptional regulator [Streptomyces sp. NPDC050636]|uniref:MerR family transcriptional regulator n=1 Tax=Streptomyces sp. NPDC050636 TaxID=3154510 RepID=UPI00341AA5D5
MEPRLLPIGTVAERFEVAVSTLHYWERRGIIQPTERRSGRRYYDADEVYRISLIVIWQETGLMSLDEIAAVLAGRTGSTDWRDIVGSRLAEIDTQIRRLADAREYLGHMLACPRDNPARDCPELRTEVDMRHAERH